MHSFFLLKLTLKQKYIPVYTVQGRIQGGRAPPLKLEKNMIFHTKYPKNFRASLHSAQFF